MKLPRNRRADVIWACVIVGVPLAIAFIGVPLVGIPLARWGFAMTLDLLAMYLPFAVFFLLVVAYQRQALRWRRRLILTVLLGLGSVFIHSLLICGCHFHPLAVPVMLVPVVWGGYALGTYRDRKEQVVGWIAFAVAVFSLWLGFESNIMFAVR